MKTGVILYSHRADPLSHDITEWYAEELRRRGHTDVNTAYRKGDPGIDETMRRMNVRGMNNTFVVIPMVISEGSLSTWILPKEMDMPDNSCSFTYLTGMHTAIRFSTALGESENISKLIIKRLKEAGAEKDDGILLVSRGSVLKMNLEFMKRNSVYVQDSGFPNTAFAVLDHEGPNVASAVGDLMEKGAERLVVLPVFLTECRSVTETIPSLVRDSGPLVTVVFAKCLGKDSLILDAMEERIPEGW